METTTHYCLSRHGFIILLLVTLVSNYVSCLDSRINGSYDNTRDIIIHRYRKRVLSSSKSGEPNQQPLCLETPGPKDIVPILCVDGYVISDIKFADYGQPTGDCESTFKRGNCGAPATLRLVKKNCLGKQECYFLLRDEMFGPTHCKGPVRFAFSGSCKKKRKN
ncbi:beta-galactosidase 15-like [Capsella rubella]|uniref:beta-galactosidase 15-like n=1 Tax=Capsella rubella TaxID=81985 RepID=UPI000CD57EBC|nr:beta-galactosidase 15-like [Capsella rubella]